MSGDGSDNADLQALFDQVAAERDTAGAAAAGADDGPAGRLLAGIGNLTRSLHDNLRQLGLDRDLEQAAHAIPDARDRLAYVATMTEQAAQRSLTATELAKPIQDRLGADAAALSARWAQVFARTLKVEEFPALCAQTRAYLERVPQDVGRTNLQLLEIMMAQDFQDLTGQVIKKITDIIQHIEQQLVKLLIENTPAERRSKEANSLLNGPVVNPAGLANAVTSQKQVDDLLESLGF